MLINKKITALLIQFNMQSELSQRKIFYSTFLLYCYFEFSFNSLQQAFEEVGVLIFPDTHESKKLITHKRHQGEGASYNL